MKNKEIFINSTDPRIEFFDSQASHWDDDIAEIERTLRRVDELLDLLRLHKGQDVLEVGCGTGQITGWLSSVVAPGEVVAIDFSQKMLSRAREKGIKAKFVHLDICCDKPEGVFDVALCFHSFPHFRDKESALKNISASLKPAGSLIVLHLASSEQINSFHKGVGDAVGEDFLPQQDDWDRLLSVAGLELDTYIDKDDLFFLRAVKNR
ncbi:MAG: methyltransferase domain-containing protein [Planctomycetes bacterium]|nr:methyltransferase domain-containing protein [Planctomycetota bacterium]